MNKATLITTAILAGTAAVVAAVRIRKQRKNQQVMAEPSTTRHLTDVFSKAKHG